jgi:acetoin utilization protein AcuB
MKRHRPCVRDWMTPDPVTTTPFTSLGEAYDLMLDRDLRRLPVVDEDGELIGIITRSDIERVMPWEDGAQEDGRMSLAHTLVRQVMSWDPLTVAPDDLMPEAAERMLEMKVSGLPVVENRRCVGILTESDILRLVISLRVREEHPNPATSP